MIWQKRKTTVQLQVLFYYAKRKKLTKKLKSIHLLLLMYWFSLVFACVHNFFV